MSGLEAAERAAQGAELGRIIAAQVKAAIAAALAPVLARLDGVDLEVKTLKAHDMPGKLEAIGKTLDMISRIDEEGATADQTRRAALEKAVADIAKLTPLLERIDAVELTVKGMRESTALTERIDGVAKELADMTTRIDNAKVEARVAVEKVGAEMVKLAGAPALELTGERIAKLWETTDALDGRVKVIEGLDVPGRLEFLGKTLGEVGAIVQTSGVELEKRIEEIARSTEGLIKTASEIEELKGDKGDEGPTGASVVDALISRAGNLVLTLADGRVKDVGPVCGKDGDPGFELEDFDVELDGDRELLFSFRRGEKTVERKISVPWLLDRGVFDEGTQYKAGDGTTWGGALWLAQRDTTAKPGTDDSWRLAVKKGRDGRDARGQGNG